MSVLKFFLIVLTFCPSSLLLGQNLLPNPSFEDTLDNNKTPLYPPADWKSANREGFNYYTPYHYHTTDARDSVYAPPYNHWGYQKARTGKAYLGTVLMHLYSIGSNQRNGRREYMQAQLKRSLKADSTYCFQIYVSLADSMRYASRGLLGVYFSNTAIYGNHWEHLPYSPQIVLSPNQYITDKVNWVKYSGTYKAMGGEEYLTMGNFNDTTIIDTIFVGGGVESDIANLDIYYYLDDVFLGSCDSLPDTLTGVREHRINENARIYPNPSHGIINLEYAVRENKAVYFELYDLLGRKQHRQRLNEGKSHIIKTEIPTALYIYQLKSNGKTVQSGKIIIE